MLSFFRDMQYNDLLITGVLAGVLASLACGVIGPYVVARRIVFLSGAIAHITVGGVGATLFLKDLFPAALAAVSPLHGAIVVALLSAVGIGIVYQRVGERMDTLIGAMWAVGMAVGIMLAKFTSGYQTELMTYLFGNIALVSWNDIYLLAAMVAIILIIVAVAHKRLLALCLDEEFAALQGVNVLRTHILLLVLVALTVVTLTQVVGLILVIALLTLPAATAGHHASRLGPMMALATLLCLGLTVLPRAAVYDLQVVNGRSVSPESAIVLAAGAVYLASVAYRRLRSTQTG